MAEGIFQRMTDQFVTKLGADLFQDIGNFISNISPLFAAGFGIYICIIALDAYNRGLDENAVDLSKRMFGWLIIISFAFNASQYSVIANWIYGMPDTIVAAFGQDLDAKLFDVAVSKMENISIVFDQIRLKLLDDPLDNLGLILAFIVFEIMIDFMALLFLGVVFAYYVVAKILLALNLMVGPLFIGSMLFPATRQYGMNWIGQCLNSILTIALLAVLAGIEISFFIETIKLNFGDGSHIDDSIIMQYATLAAMLGVLAIFITMTVVFIFAAFKVPAMASALTGGASMEGVSGGMVRYLPGAAASLAKKFGSSAAKQFQKLFNPKGGSIKPR